MEVLTCSELQYVGDSNCPQQSPGTIAPSEMHDGGPKLVQADYPAHKVSGDDVFLGVNNEDKLMTAIDSTPSVPKVESFGDVSGMMEIDFSVHNSRKQLLNGSSLSLDCSRMLEGDEPPHIVNETVANFKTLESSFHLQKDVQIGSANHKLFLDKSETTGNKAIQKNGQTHKTFETERSAIQHDSCKELASSCPEQSSILGSCDLVPKMEVKPLYMLKEEFPSDNEQWSKDYEQATIDLKPIETLSLSLDKEANNAPNGNLPAGSSTTEAESIEQDEAAALWVKWRGKWQAGIRCARADWPLSTLKARPTHGRKKYFVVFFPNTRTHSWADMLLVRPISELPEPLAYGTHYSGLEMVKDLTTPRRYIMQKLAVSMLNLSDELHTEAVIERARHVAAWKEFAMEAYRCETYSDLGRMLLKLYRMILPAYIDPVWLEQSFGAWSKCCESAQTAETVETLTKELVESVLWDQVESLWDAPVQPDLGSDWKTWKQEVLKWFSTSHPPVASGDSLEVRNCDESSCSSGANMSRKRPKLEVRRAEPQTSQVEEEADQVNIDSGFFHDARPENVGVNNGESRKGLHSGGGDGWVEIVVEAGNPDFTRNVEEKPPMDADSGTKILVNPHQGSHVPNKYRQCMAFIAAKGRQCGRWANDGELYCCVHLSCRYAEKAAKIEETPPSFSNAMCEGTTNHGERCKHRARFGSSFCKKHRPQGSQMSSGTQASSANDLKRKFSESTGKEIILVPDQSHLTGNLNSAFERETPEGRDAFDKEPTENFGASSPATGEGCLEESPCCIVWSHEGNSQCLEAAKLHTLYCERHRPNFLKRARNGKSRIISKEYFLDLLRNCNSRNQKVQLHQACELLYGFMKSAMNRRNRVSKDHLMEWILSEASKDFKVGDFLMRLVSLEKEKIEKLWGLDVEKTKQVSTSVTPLVESSVQRSQKTTIIKCKICAEDFLDDQTLGAHWMDVHKKEAQWLFRGYACAVCMTSFTNRKVLEVHVKEKHHVPSLDQCVLFQCMPCGNHFVNPEQLWVHVLSLHSMDFRLRSNSEPQAQQTASQSLAEPENIPCSVTDIAENNVGNHDGTRRFICRFCGLKFDLLPDLGRHHQAAHMGPNATGHFPPKRRSLFGASRLRPGRPRSRFKKVLGGSFQIGNSSSFSLKKRFQDSNTVNSSGLNLLTQVSEVAAFEKSIEPQCFSVAETLFKDIEKTELRPTNLDILSMARSTCCKVALHTALEQRFGVLPERLYLKAAKLCSELNIPVEWHREGFVCPQGCKTIINPCGLAPLDCLLEDSLECASKQHYVDYADTVDELEMEECHYIISGRQLKQKSLRTITVLCEDISFGKEQTPVACVVDQDLQVSTGMNGQKFSGAMPWEGFTYVTDRLLDPSLGLDTKSSQLGCACSHPNCSPETCDHVYLFDNDYESAKDIHGNPMHGRFPYDEMGRIVLEEGFLVYECNSMCSCDRSCCNRVLQNGVQVKLEVFKTKNKGWAVRAGKVIPRGTFVCEYIGEVLNDQEANKRGERYDHEGCSYLYDIDAHIEDMGGTNEGCLPYVIDATKYGNVARFINHSCSPNLVNYQVLVESMDCQLAHIGLYANRDIAKGEELAYDYRYKLLPGEGCRCHCGAANCRGRLY